MTGWDERVLRRFCRPVASTPHAGTVYGSVEEARAELMRAFGEDRLGQAVRGKRVLDFGCGFGHHARALLDIGASEVWGVDVNSETVEYARAQLVDQPGARIVHGLEQPDWADGQAFDAVLSMNSMEHIEDPAGWLRRWAGLLAEKGRILVCFGPLWLSPAGSHMGYMTPVPWVNVLFRERTVMRVRADYRPDGATRYEEIAGGLNRMTRRKFHRCLRAAGLEPEWIRYVPVRGLTIATRIPGVNEFFTQSLSAVLRPRDDAPGGTA